MVKCYQQIGYSLQIYVNSIQVMSDSGFVHSEAGEFSTGTNKAHDERIEEGRGTPKHQYVS